MAAAEKQALPGQVSELPDLEVGWYLDPIREFEPVDQSVGTADNNAGFSRPMPNPAAASRLSCDGPTSSYQLLQNMPEKSVKAILHPVHSMGGVPMGSSRRRSSLLDGMGLRQIWDSFSPTSKKDLSPISLANRGPRLTHMASRFGDAIHKMAGPPSDQIKQRIDQPVAEVQDLNRMRMNASNFSMMGNSFSDSHLLAADSAFVVHPLSNLRRWWDLHLLLMTLVLSALIPWRITFRWPDLDEDFLTGKRLHTGISGFAYFADAVYILDFALTFNCGFIRERDFVVVMNRKKIVLGYLKRWLFYDFLTSIPLTFLFSFVSDLKTDHALRIASVGMVVLRLPRAVRAKSRLMVFLTNVSSFTVRIAQFVVLFAFFLHWNSCFQYLVAEATGFPDGCWVEQLGLQYQPLHIQYLWSLYNASSQMLALGYGPIDPTLNQEVMVVMISFMLSTFLFPILISIITTSLIARDSLREEHNRKLEVWNQYMAHRRLPIKMRDRIRSFLHYRWRTHRGINEERMLGDLPSALQVEVRLITCQSLIRQVPMFKGAPKGFVSSLVPHMHLELFLQGEWIIREATTGREMYFIHTGSVDVIQEGIVIDHLENGQCFGEVALMHEVNRTASCWAATNCEVSVLKKTELDQVLADFPDVRSKMDDEAHNLISRDVKRTITTSRMSHLSMEEGLVQPRSSSILGPRILASAEMLPIDPDQSSIMPFQDDFALSATAAKP